jgi:hypothetical protein
MGSRYPYFMLGCLIVLCLVIGWVVRGIVENQPKMVFSMGYDEKMNLWNRIRVDAEGHVLCSKE